LRLCELATNYGTSQKIKLGEMRAMGIRGLLVYYSDYECSHSVEIIADHQMM
jgi:hypothetical protein